MKVTRYAYVSNSPVNMLDPFGLYEEDLHRDLGYCLGRRAGYPDWLARAVADADQAIDDNPETSPMYPLGIEARRLWHFTTRERRAELWARALDGGPEALGQFPHALRIRTRTRDSLPGEDICSVVTNPIKLITIPKKPTGWPGTPTVIS